MEMPSSQKQLRAKIVLRQIGFRGKLFLRYPPLIFTERSGGYYQCEERSGVYYQCSSDSLRYHKKRSATGIVRQESRDGGGGGGVLWSGH